MELIDTKNIFSTLISSGIFYVLVLLIKLWFKKRKAKKKDSNRSIGGGCDLISGLHRSK